MTDLPICSGQRRLFSKLCSTRLAGRRRGGPFATRCASVHPETGSQPPGRVRNLALLLLVAASGFLASCATSPSGSGGPVGSVAGSLTPSQLNHPAVKARNAKISEETPGNYYIGRRWWTEGTRFWGYLREPGKPWSTSRLVIMNESVMKQPDRVPEVGAPRVHGFDHNHEYRIWGSFTGQKIYDPNSNFMVPEFRLTKYELIDSNPGFLFHPGEKHNPRHLPEVRPVFP